MRNLKKQHNLSTFFVQSIDIDPLRYGASDAERNGAFSENGIEDLLKRAQITEDSLGYETVLVVSEVDKTQWLFPVTTTIEGDVNGTKEVHNPYEVWGAPGKGDYKGKPTKDSEGNYNICVGPKVLDFYYADSGKLWESELEHRYLKILLENKKTGEQISKNCYVLTNKAHTYNTYPVLIEYQLSICYNPSLPLEKTKWSPFGLHFC